MFAIGFKEQLQKEAASPDGMIDLEDFDLDNMMKDLPFFEDQDGTLDVEDPMPESNPQKVPKSIEPSKN